MHMYKPLLYLILIVKGIVTNEAADPKHDVVVLQKDRRIICAAGSSAASSALALLPPLKAGDDTSRLTFDKKDSCNFLSPEPCDAWNQEGWTLVSSLNYPAPLLKDWRWEHVEADHLGYRESKLFNLGFSPERWQLSLSLSAINDADIMLCSGETFWTFPCYWFILNGWDGGRAALRLCKEEKISQTEYPKKSCSRLRDFRDEASCSAEEWSSFQVKWDISSSVISLHRNEESKPWLNLNMTLRNPISVKYLIIRSRGYLGSAWKVHKYNYLTNGSVLRSSKPLQLNGSFCLAVTYFLDPSDDTFSAVVSTSATRLPLDLHEIKADGQWHEVKLMGTSTEYDFLSVEINRLSPEDHVSVNFSVGSIRFCSKDEVRVLSPGSSTDVTGCQLMQFYNVVTRINDKRALPSEQTGCDGMQLLNNCTVNCSELTKSDCSKTKICSTNGCICSAGYTGSQCTEDCRYSTYGIGCKGRCPYNCYNCHNVEGCIKCRDDYKPPECASPLPVLKAKLKCVGSSPTQLSCSVRDWEHTGQATTPVTYYYELQEINTGQWLNTTHINTSINTFLITNLKPATNYKVRVIIMAGKYYSSNSVSVEATTPCTCPLLDIHVDARSAMIDLMKDRATDCPRNNLSIRIKGRNSFSLGKVEGGLKPFKEYEIIVELNKNIDICNTTIKTKESAPSAVTNIGTSKVTESSAIVSWNMPDDLNGILRGYNITLELVRYKNCKYPENKIVSSFETNETQWEFSNLEPYVVYNVYVVAYTVAPGNANRTSIETLSSATPAVAPGWCEKPKVHDTWIEVCLNVDDCTKLGGDFQYELHVSDINKLLEQKTEIHGCYESDCKFKVYDLQPYTDYVVTVYHKRYDKQSLGPGNSSYFKTLAAAPGQVEALEAFSQGNTFVSLRWGKPYPPKGELLNFILDQPRTQINLTHVCDLWEGKYCYNVTGLSPETWYNFKLLATNKGNNNDEILLGEASTIRANTREKEPSAPVYATISRNGQVCSLKWTTPFFPHGNIRTFVVWAHVNYTDLVMYPEGNETSRNVAYSDRDKEYVIQLDWLFPSTEYTVGVYGLNEYYGENASVSYKSAHEPPAFDGNVRVEEDSVHNGTVVVVIPASRGRLIKNSTIFVVISVMQGLSFDATNKFVIEDPAVKSIFSSEFQALKDGKLWIATEIKPTKTSSKFVIGDNSISSPGTFGRDYNNRPLRENEEFNVTLLLVNKHYDDQVLWAATSEIVNMLESGPRTSKLWLMSLILLIVPILLYWLYYRLRHRGEDRDKFVTDTDSSSRMNMSLMDVAASIKPMLKEPDVEQRLSRRICISDLDNYVTRALASGELQRQHQLFPRGPTQPSERGQLPQNKTKNRYAKLGAYDANRVVLETLPDDPFSDYINANFIEGYRANKFYIAAQGPKPNTLGDFWRMIWQENVKLVIMLTNLVEGGKTKCEKYWPDNQKQLIFGPVIVLCASCRVSADFTVSTLHATRNGEKRTVLHYHFTSWPDHGVPLYTQSVAEFLKKILATPHGPGPMVIHCSAGVGRTGTVILADLCLRMAATEGAVDVLAFQQRLREQRANMVDNFEQYKLVHLILLECLVEESTALSCEGDLETRVAQLRTRGNIQRQFQRLEQQTMLRESQAIDVTVLEQVKHKNRLNNVVPDLAGRVYLSRLPDGDANCDYINAVFVDGFRTKSQFITTQMPLPHTIADFWRMILERKSTLVIVLNHVDLEDPTMCTFWPSSKVPLITSPDVSVKMVNEHATDNLVIQTLQLVSASRTENVKMVHVEGWSSSQLVPASPTTLLRLWQEAERPSSAPIIVTCRDGVTACGLFVALAFLVEKIKLEQICDVSQAVRIVKQNRKEFVQSVEQFNFLFDAGVTYVHEFATYANFN